MGISVFRKANDPNPRGTLGIGAVVERIRSNGVLAARTAEARRILADEGKGGAYRDYKAANLPGVTWAGEFASRRAASLTAASGLVFVESDDVSDAAAERDRLAVIPSVAVAYISVGGDGVHCAATVYPAPTADTYIDAWTAAVDVLDITPDKAAKDIARLAFLAHDPDAKSNPDAGRSRIRWSPGLAAHREATERKVATRANTGGVGRRKDGGTGNWIDDALAALDPDGGGYNDWLLVGMALHAGEQAGAITDGLAKFDAWSAKGAKYTAGEPERRWMSFKGSGATLGTLWYKAQAAGWNPNAAKVLCKACGANFHKRDFPTCWDAACRAAARFGGGAEGGELRPCRTCGQYRYSDSGHPFDACDHVEERELTGVERLLSRIAGDGGRAPFRLDDGEAHCETHNRLYLVKNGCHACGVEA